jgi:hypothetical protein
LDEVGIQKPGSYSDVVQFRDDEAVVKGAKKIVGILVGVVVGILFLCIGGIGTWITNGSKNLTVLTRPTATFGCSAAIDASNRHPQHTATREHSRAVTLIVVFSVVLH